MNFPTVASTAAGLIGRMVTERAFSMAVDSLIDHIHLLDDAALRTLINAVCASYDAYQLNSVDEVKYRRKEFVEHLAGAVGMSQHQPTFVNPSTAFAFAFHPTTRRAFISLACKSEPATLDLVFANKAYRDMPRALITYEPLDGGHARDLVLRDMYWGRDLDEHVVRFLSVGLPPYIATWHSSEALLLKCHSLTIGNPSRSFITTAAEIARRCLLIRSNVTMCGKLFDNDPKSSEQPMLRDSILVAPTLQMDFLPPRFCVHFGMTGMRSSPTDLVERLCAAEQLICILEPIRLPPYVLLELVEWLFKIGSFGTQFARNVTRVYAKSDSIRAVRAESMRVDRAPKRINQ